MPLARWSDGSIRWALVEIVADLSKNDRLELVSKSESPQPPGSPNVQCVALARPTNGHLEFQIHNSETQNKLPLLDASMEISGAWGTTQILLDVPSNWSARQNDLGIAFETLKVIKNETLPLPIEFRLSVRSILPLPFETQTPPTIQVATGILGTKVPSISKT
jgi:hypothetical protein